MADELKMDYAMMDSMRQSFLNGADMLEDVRKAILQISEAAEEGALVGDGGDAFVEALNYNLASSVSDLFLKFRELADDIEGAVEDMRSADESSAGTMGG
jgi:uncharacterized protein YukE